MWKIARRLYLGDRHDARHAHLLEQHGVTHVVNCAVELPCFHRGRFRYLHLRLRDPDPNFEQAIEPAVRFISRGRRKGSVLVHCAAGLSRSPSVILAWLCARGWSLERGLERLQRAVGESDAQFILPDAMFLEQIELYFDEALE